ASVGAGGQAARIAVSSRFSHGCSTALGARSTASARTWPVAGRNRVRSLAVPPRTYSWGWRAGSASGCQDGPGWGIAWYGPASSWFRVGCPALRPACTPARWRLLRGGLRVSHLDDASLPLAQRRAGRAPGPALLPGVPRVPQRPQDRPGAD